MEFFWKYIFPVLLIAAGIAAYLFFPVLIDWVAAHIQGLWGVLWLAIAGAALWLWLYFGMGFRGGGMKYATLVILFTAVCIWLVANWGWFTDYLEMHLGQWGMIGVLLLIVVIVLLGRFFLF